MYESLITPPAVAPATSGGNPSIDAALAAEGVSGREAEFIKSIYQQESGSGSNTKTSNAGAVGGMQIIPSTFRSVADQGWDIQNPEHNLRAGIRYARQGYKESGGDPVLAGAFYYGGPGGMAKARDGIAVSDPRNPNAPNTLQYGAQVAKRMGAAPAATAAAAAPADAPYFTPASGGYASLITPPPLARTTLEAAKDVALGAGAGVVQGVEMVASAFGADNAVARGANDAAQSLIDMQSPARKQQREQRAAAIQEAETSGSTWAEIVANVGAFADAPAESTLNAIGTSVPTLLTALIPGLGQANVARLVVQGAVGAAQGAGAVKGSIYEAVERELSKPGPGALSKDDAKKAAAAAQAYDSQNGGDIALGALLGFAAGTTGMEKSLAKILSKEGGEAAAAGVAKRAAMGVLAEAPTEGLQGGQERLAANRALQNEGVDVPTWQGVAGSAAGEAVASVVPGGVFGALTPSKPQLPPELAPVAEKAAEPNSPLSKAAMAANTPEVVAQREAQRRAAEPAPAPASANTAARLAELESIGEGRPEQTVKDDQGRDVRIPAEPGRFFTPEEKAEYDDLVARRDATPGAIPKEADVIGDRAKEIAAAVRESGALEALRSPDSPVKASDLVKDLATAQSPNTPAAAREQALGRVEFALQWAGIDLAARPEPVAVQEPAAQQAAPAAQADPVIAAMSDPKVSAADKTALRDAYNTALNVRLPQATRDQALAQAREIAGRYAAPPAAPAVPAAAQTPAVLGPIDGAPGTLLAQAERMEEGAFELEAADFPDEAQQLRDQAASLREQAATVRAGETGQDLEADAPAGIVSPESQQTVALPTVRSTPAGDGPAYLRRRRASLQQLAANGFTTVRRDGEQFAMTNPKTGQTFSLDGAADAQLARKAIADNISAAAAQTNTDPTDGQKSAGNYKKARVDFEGITIAIENPVGSERKGKSDNGKAWATPMNLAHYGYLPSTSAADGDGVDVYVMNTPRIGAQAYVIDQYNEDGSFDETKTVLGASSEAEALRVYDAGFSDGSGPDRRGAVTAMSIADFKAWANTPAAKKPAGPAPEPAPGAVVEGSMKVKLSEDESVSIDLIKELPEVESVARGGRATRISKKQGAVIKAIAQAFGKRVQFYTGADSGRVGDGFIMPNDQGTIYLNATSSMSPVVVFGHELMHQLKRDNPEAHAAIEAVVARRMNREAVATTYGKLGYNNGQIMEELISDLGGDLMADKAFWADVMAEVREANGDGPAKKILAQLAEFLYRAIDAMSRNLRSYADTGAGSKLVDDMTEIRAAFQAALAGYMQTRGIAKPSMQAEILRAGQEAKRSAVRNQTPEDQRKALAEKLRGTDGWLKAPNGKRTNLDERQWVVVRTPAFKAWFGDWESDPANASKAVDENGEPKVFYHGSTEAGFTEFDTDGKGKTEWTGAFFADDFRMAVGYSGTRNDAPVYPAERVFADPDLIDGLSIEEAGILVEVVTNPRGGKSWEWYESEEAALEDLELDPGEELAQKPGYRMTDPDGYETVGTKEEIIDAISDIRVRAPGVYDAFLNVRDLVTIDWQGKNWDDGPEEQIWNILDEDGEIYDTAYSQEDADAILAKNPGFSVEQTSQAQYDSTDDAARSGRDMGADGVLIKDVFDTGPKGYAEDGNVLVVYDPRNIKSASANTGAFDSANANITRSADRSDSPEFRRWFGRPGVDSNLVNEDGSPMRLYHGTNAKFTEFRRSKTGAMGPGIYLGDDRSVAEAYDGNGRGEQIIMEVYARGKYLSNRQWSDYVFKHGWAGAEAAAKADGWSGVRDTRYESAVSVWDPADIKSATNNTGEFGEGADITRSAARADQAQAAIKSGATETPEFKAWFGDSKVVDANGKPLVMYHGTYGDFDTFKRRTGDIGLHFGDAATASDRIDTAVPHRGNKDGKTLSANVMPVYLSIKNPIRLPDSGFWNAENMKSELLGMFPQDAARIGPAYSSRVGLKSTKDIREFLQSKGYDGVVYKNTGEVPGSAPFRERVAETRAAMSAVFPKGKNSFDQNDQKVPEYKAWSDAERAYREHRENNGTDSYIAFEPNQVKSATGNNGEFSRKDNSIVRSATRDDALTVEGYHFSHADRPLLTTGMYGTGLRGSARDAIMSHPDKRLRQRLSFYFDKGTGIRPESGVGGRAHRVLLTGVYDADVDPLKLKSADARAFESRLLDAGYSGYMNRMEGTQPGQVIMLGRQTFTPELLGAQSYISASRRIAPIENAPSRWLTQASGEPAMLQARLERMQASDSWSGYELRINGRELQARAKPGGQSITRSASRLRDDPMEVSSRAPWGKTASEDPIADLLVVGLDSSRAGEKAFEKNIALVREYPNYRPTKSASTTERQAERFIEMSKDNLLWLYDSVPAEIRERSHLWYDGANRIAKTWAPKYSLQPSQIAGVMAVLSPQKDWFMNVDLARRVIDTMSAQGSARWNAEMTATAKRIFGKPQYADDVAAITGKTLDEVNDLVLKAMWVRAYDETYNDRAHALLSPEGDVMGKVMTMKNAPSKVAWGDLGSISKAVAIIQDGSLANISARLGGEHKVRNFYNNILVPNGANGHVTIDTHAVAAALLRPLSGSSLEVLHNFGSAGAASSAIHGSSGTYGLYAEAYRRAAAERGILAREMQSITWEAVRGLFTPGFKSQQKNVDTTDGIWENYSKGRLSLENARQQILETAGGIEEPSWFRSGTGSPAPEGRGDAGVVPGVQLPGRRAGSAAGGAGGPDAEAAATQRSANRSNQANADRTTGGGSSEEAPVAGFGDNGRSFTGFFSNISAGKTGKTNGREHKAVIPTAGIKRFVAEYNKHRGNFDDHIAASIPGFREVQTIVGSAIAKTFERANMLDIGGSEGALAKAVAKLSNGGIKTVVLDPNFAMADHFLNGEAVDGAEYVTSAFGQKEDEGLKAWTEDDYLVDRNGKESANPYAGRTIRFYKPDRKFDVIHEAMVFQFISGDREGQVSRAKELMNPGGVLILEQKFVAGDGLTSQQFRANEEKKDAYKEQFFSKEEIAAKAKAVGVAERAEFDRQQADSEQKVVGMNDLMASPGSLEGILGSAFKHVVQFWDSGNFKGYLASDSRANLDRLLGNMLPTDSEFSTIQTPREILRSVDRVTTTSGLPKATLADFEPRGISRLLSVDNWAILTAENPMGEQAGEKTNAAAMRRLRQRLAEMDGVEFRAIRGKYGDNEENSLAVVGITEEQAVELGREFNQDSVLTRKGLIYQDGSINPATGIEVFRSPPENYYSRVGDTIFRIDIDFDTKINPAADAAYNQRIDALKELIACLGK